MYFKSDRLFLIVMVACLLLPAICFSASFTIRWNANKEADLSGYNVYYGTSSRKYGPPIPVGKRTSYTVKNLKEGKKYYVALTARDNSGNESGLSSEISVTTNAQSPQTSPSPSTSDLIDLPSRKSYGRMPGKDQSHVDRVRYAFTGKKGDYKLKYSVYDVDNNREVRILLNGTTIGYADTTTDNGWSKKKTLVLQDALVKDNGNNIVEFVNTYNPPNQYEWGVKKVRVKRIKVKQSKASSSKSSQSNQKEAEPYYDPSHDAK